MSVKIWKFYTSILHSCEDHATTMRSPISLFQSLIRIHPNLQTAMPCGLNLVCNDGSTLLFDHIYLFPPPNWWKKISLPFLCLFKRLYDSLIICWAGQYYTFIDWVQGQHAFCQTWDLNWSLRPWKQVQHFVQMVRQSPWVFLFFFFGRTIT